MAIYVGTKRYAPYIGDKRRRYMGGGGGEEPLPQGAIRIEYLRFTGTQYIDTGFTPDKNSSIDLKVYLNSDDTYIFGSSIHYNDRSFEAYTYGRNNIEVNYGGIYATQALGQYASRWTTLALRKNVAYLFDAQGTQLYSYTFNEVDFTCPNTLFLGALHRGNNGQTVLINSKTFDMGAVQIKDSDTLIRDYIPCRIGQDGYLYDTISESFYGNSGTGSFTLGPDKT